MTLPKTVNARRHRRDWDAEDCCMLSTPFLYLQLLALCHPLHPTSFLMIFILYTRVVKPYISFWDERRNVRTCTVANISNAQAHAYNSRTRSFVDHVYIRSKLRPFHVKIMACRSLNLAVGRLSRFGRIYRTWSRKRFYNFS